MTIELAGNIELIPYLLEWIQDINWPIAPRIIEILLQYPQEVVPFIKDIFRLRDYEWEENCIWYYIRHLLDQDKEMYREDLELVAYFPTALEKTYEIDLTAKNILSGMNSR
ncbi:hypothetical protein D3C76_1438860 [compost metagenome]